MKNENYDEIYDDDHSNDHSNEQPRERMHRQFGHHGLGGRPGFGEFGGMRHQGGFRMSRGRIQPAVMLSLLDGPKHGYDIIRDIEEKSQGLWKPSAGSIYPLLAKLERDNFVTKEKIDERNVYTLTEKGAKHAQRFSEKHGHSWDEFGSMFRESIRMKEIFEDYGRLVKDVMRSKNAAKMNKLLDRLEEIKEELYILVYES